MKIVILLLIRLKILIKWINNQKMKLNITCKDGVYSNPIKITFNNKSKTLTYKNSKVTFNFDTDTEYELTIEQIHKDKESVPTRVTNIVLNIISQTPF